MKSREQVNLPIVKSNLVLSGLDGLEGFEDGTECRGEGDGVPAVHRRFLNEYFSGLRGMESGVVNEPRRGRGSACISCMLQFYFYACTRGDPFLSQSRLTHEGTTPHPLFSRSLRFVHSPQL